MQEHNIESNHGDEKSYEGVILIASSNEHKQAEILRVGERFGMRFITPQELQREKGLPDFPIVEEKGRGDYRENALLKAQAFSRWGGMDALGDDSGLEVDALGGRPGINSRRYAGEDATDEQKIQKLLAELSAIENRKTIERTCAFNCTLVLIRRDGSIIDANYKLSGTVLRRPRGHFGFGYDPIVYIPSIGQTLAEADFETVCTKGFRAQALENLFAKL